MAPVWEPGLWPGAWWENPTIEEVPVPAASGSHIPTISDRVLLSRCGGFSSARKKPRREPRTRTQPFDRPTFFGVNPTPTPAAPLSSPLSPLMECKAYRNSGGEHLTEAGSCSGEGNEFEGRVLRIQGFRPNF